MADPASNPNIDWPRVAPLGILLASLGALASAYTAQYGFDLEPCILCLYQRIPYAVAGVLALLALLTPRQRKDGAMVLMVIAAGAAFTIGAGIAFYHVGVEQHWWVSAAACGGGGAAAPESVDQLRQLLMAAKPVKACDEIEWTLFGLSMATYNVAVSFALAAGSFWGASKIRRAA